MYVCFRACSQHYMIQCKYEFTHRENAQKLNTGIVVLVVPHLLELIVAHGRWLVPFTVAQS